MRDFRQVTSDKDANLEEIREDLEYDPEGDYNFPVQGEEQTRNRSIDSNQIRNIA